MLLEILVSILYFVNKLLLLLDRKSGWTTGLFASGLAMIFFLQLSLYLFFALELACFLIMILGIQGEKLSARTLTFIYGIVAFVMLLLLWNVNASGWFEFITSILFMIAFLYLANRKARQGWIFLGISHLLMLWITFDKSAYFFAALQGASAIVCIIGVIKTYNLSNKHKVLKSTS